MATYELRCEQRFPLSLVETFEFFKDPANLSRITPPWLNFVIRTRDLRMEKGAEIDYTIRWMGIPLGWKTIIADYEPPFEFVDVQARGPYKLWHHRHSFRPTEEGTLVTDIIHYELPLGFLGAIAHRLFVRRQLHEIFRFRQEALSEILGGATESAPPVIQPAC